MTGSLSEYAQGVIAKYVTGAAIPAAPTNLFMALSSADPLDNGTGLDENLGGGYARQPITFGALNTTNTEGTSTSNNAPVEFTGLAGTASHFAIFDAVSGGNMIFFGELDVARVVTTGDSVSFAVGVCRLTLGGFVGSVLSEAFMDWMKGTDPAAAPASVEIGLSRASPMIDGSGVDYPEGTDGYAPKEITFDAPSFVHGQGTTIASNTDIVFGPAVTNPWGTITHATIIDSGTQDILLQGPVSHGVLIPVGEGLGIVSGAVSFKIF